MYSEKELVKIAKRENNTKRSYLVVNPLQGKHIPGSPQNILELFDELVKMISEEYKDEELLLIGFAETATAIGAEAAIILDSKYIQTTREIIPNVEYLYFAEEHSHATEQKLVKNDIDSVVGIVDRIVFVEDEVTTGKTILNIISIMEKLYPGQFKFAVLSLLNGMSEEHIIRYQFNNINLHYLIKTSHNKYGDKAASYQGDGIYNLCNSNQEYDIEVIDVDGYVNARRLVESGRYKNACQYLWERISKKILDLCKKKVLVIGTEEFMYPALYVGREIEKMGNIVKCHSTTRSPISVSSEEDYPLKVRYELKSLYDDDRKTFIYDIDEYDKVVIITDASLESKLGLYTLYNALKMKNQDILTIRWC